ncbi:hypothetical protein [Clostridium sp. YIM B02506]|uniref:hypothetical protein n=1 Tax=Clostridium sp. YIM B02506 TaxID=2910680 RepID=UPI001EEDFF65|nr:hypothetical protein [Clostridium sp. YIM B02506]
MKSKSLNKLDLLIMLVFIFILSFTLYIRHPNFVEYYWVLYIVAAVLAVYIAIRLYNMKK